MVLKSLENATSEMITETGQDSLILANEIQQHGVVFVLKEPELEIIQVSDNTDRFFNIPGQELMNKNIAQLFDKSALETIENHCQRKQIELYNPLQITLNLQDKPQVFEAVLRRKSEGLILELEPSYEAYDNASLSFYQLFRSS
ncbi:MAG: histidine kinase, partial [Crocosphaera sp.]